MDEKRAIIDELLTQARICLDEKASINVRTVSEYENIPSSCSNCGTSLREIYTRPEELNGKWNDYDLVVLKCEKCRLFYAVWIQPFTYDPTFLEPAIEDERRLWGEDMQPKFSRKLAKAYGRDGSKQEDANKRLNSFVQSRLAEMYRHGLSNETINAARNKVLTYLKNNCVTSKKLVSLWAAAIYEASNEELTCIGGVAKRGEKLSERKIEETFGVTRKTIRKWRKLLPNRLTDLYM